MELNAWYLLYCKRKEQERAEQHLTRQGVECYFPQVLIEKVRRGRRAAKLEPLFPNYLFVRFDPEIIAFLTVRSTRGVADFVRNGNFPCKVPLELIHALMVKEYTQGQRGSLNETFKTGEIVEIIDGPYVGAEAIFKETDGERRAILLINMLNQQVELSEDYRHLKKR